MPTYHNGMFQVTTCTRRRVPHVNLETPPSCRRQFTRSRPAPVSPSGTTCTAPRWAQWTSSWTRQPEPWSCGRWRATRAERGRWHQCLFHPAPTTLWHSKASVDLALLVTWLLTMCPSTLAHARCLVNCFNLFIFYLHFRFHDQAFSWCVVVSTWKVWNFMW